MARHKDTNWNLVEAGTPNPSGGNSYSYNTIQTALLMDIRDELKEANISLRALRCPNFLRIPRVLDRISRNTVKKKRVCKTAQA